MYKFIQNRRVEIAILLLLIIIAWPISSCIVNSNYASIEAWVKARGETVQEIDYKYINIGPYFYWRNTRVYWVKTKNNIYWFRFGLWNPSVYQEISPGEYKELNYN